MDWIGQRMVKRNRIRTLLLGTLMAAMCLMTSVAGMGQTASGGDTVLTAAEATKLLPASVFFRGQSATTQLRNSGGVKFADGMFVLAMLVDTSGYASDVQQKYQAYFITEEAIKIEGHELPAGIYGVGFLKVTAEGGGFRLYTGRSYVGFGK